MTKNKGQKKKIIIHMRIYCMMNFAYSQLYGNYLGKQNRALQANEKGTF